MLQPGFFLLDLPIYHHVYSQKNEPCRKYDDVQETRLRLFVLCGMTLRPAGRSHQEVGTLVDIASSNTQEGCDI